MSSLTGITDAFFNEINLADIISIENEGMYMAVFAWITIQIIFAFIIYER